MTLTPEEREALKYAIALCEDNTHGDTPTDRKVADALTTLRDRLDKAEPVATVNVGDMDHGPFVFRETPYGADTLCDGEHKLYAAAPAAQQALSEAEFQSLRYVGGLQNATLRNLLRNKGVQLQDAGYRESVEKQIAEWDDLIVKAMLAAAPRNEQGGE